MIKSEHYAHGDVAQRLERLNRRWEELLQASKKKGQKLEKARDHHIFNQEADNFELFINDKVAWKYSILFSIPMYICNE